MCVRRASRSAGGKVMFTAGRWGAWIFCGSGAGRAASPSEPLPRQARPALLPSGQRGELSKRLKKEIRIWSPRSLCRQE